MAKKAKKTGKNDKPAPRKEVVLTNRKVGRDYTILEQYEAGVALRGTEVKSLRAGQGNLSDAFVKVEKGEAWLYNCDIQPYEFGNRENHVAKAPRRLLLHKNEIRKLFGQVSTKGRTIVALKLYWKGSRIKAEIGVAVGKNVRDKRQDLKSAAMKRDVEQAMKEARY